ncbi:hypothetical protein GYMLUDRAFT_46401 [Collybiopsis luxurians FD-317 M1]|uniref:Uncharacterized protein n=1 Tax=Collybiopsis luxurians FD-317 M1 TaxID=944289 RepID=A0A0D0C403_9AGAR|nr:hypothetical protein GYMLUDRAFT_46401 [Collybiopsis luxurians FD-317 M1]
MYFLKVSSFTSTSSLFLILAVANAVNGLAIPNERSLDARDVWVPKILTPTAETVWKTNSHGEVTWDPSNPPKQITNPKGTILLGHLDPSNPVSGLNLDIKHPLASYVDLSLGKATIQVPATTTPGKYIIVLMGNSGNRSPEFTIEAADSTASTSSSTTSSSSAENASAGSASTANALSGASSSDQASGSSSESSTSTSTGTPTPSAGAAATSGAAPSDGTSPESDPSNSAPNSATSASAASTATVSV